MNNPPRDFATLQLIVTERLEETIDREFKRQLPPSGKNDDIAIAVAAMANSEGGFIVYGIEEDRAGCASALHPFLVSNSADRLALVAQSAIDEGVTLGEVYSIPDGSDPSKGYVVAIVPKSNRRPHLFQGKAWGRNAKGRYSLSRRQLGELYAHSEGFVQEFGLTLGRPGRVKVSSRRAPRLGSSSYDYYLDFENDGDNDVFEVDWDWEATERVPKAIENPFPIRFFYSAHTVSVRIVITDSTPNGSVVTTWRDGQSKVRQASWPVSWL